MKNSKGVNNNNNNNNLDVDKKRKPKERNWVFSNYSAKQHYEDQLYQSKNR